MSLFSDALSAGFSGIEDVSGESIVYFDGANEIPVENAVRGESDFEEFPSEGEVRIRTNHVSWLVRPAKLVAANGEGFEPQRGHRLTAEDGETFEVYPGPDGKHWRWSDSRKTYFRINTVRRNVPSQ